MSTLEGYVEGMINFEGGGGGTSDYAALQNKPLINNVELVGNKTTEDLNISYDDLTNKPTIRNMPDSSGAAAGDVLTHTTSGDVWQAPVKELPTYIAENDKYLKVVNGGLAWAAASSGINYSTDEHIIGTWIDGKPLYQKTLTGSGNFTIDVASLNIDTFCGVDAGGTFYIRENTGEILTLNYANPDYVSMCSAVLLNADKANVRVISSSNLPLSNFAVTIRYTKTTDRG